jgi:hypothetical protein
MHPLIETNAGRRPSLSFQFAQSDAPNVEVEEYMHAKYKNTQASRGGSLEAGRGGQARLQRSYDSTSRRSPASSLADPITHTYVHSLMQAHQTQRQIDRQTNHAKSFTERAVEFIATQVQYA